LAPTKTNTSDSYSVKQAIIYPYTDTFYGVVRIWADFGFPYSDTINDPAYLYVIHTAPDLIEFSSDYFTTNHTYYFGPNALPAGNYYYWGFNMSMGVNDPNYYAYYYRDDGGDFKLAGDSIVYNTRTLLCDDGYYSHYVGKKI